MVKVTDENFGFGKSMDFSHGEHGPHDKCNALVTRNPDHCHCEELWAVVFWEAGKRVLDAIPGVKFPHGDNYFEDHLKFWTKPPKRI